MRLQKLTPRGMTKLKTDLEEIIRKNTVKPIINITKYEAEPVGDFKIEIDKDKQFNNKLSVGKYFLHIFPEELQPCIATWNWLAALYYKQLLNTHQKIGELRRLFIDKNHSYYPYRHLLKAPYDICKFYKKRSLSEIKFLLLDKVNISGELYRRIAENQDIIKNPEFIKTAHRFFYNENTKSLRRGVTEPIKRLIKVWRQYERSFDMYRMPSEEIINKLLARHDEFAKFIRSV